METLWLHNGRINITVSEIADILNVFQQLIQANTKNHDVALPAHFEMDLPVINCIPLTKE